MPADIRECNQKDCYSPANFRFTWPGNDEAGICLQHALALGQAAKAMGLYVQMIPLTAADYMRSYAEPVEDKPDAR